MDQAITPEILQQQLSAARLRIAELEIQLTLKTDTSRPLAEQALSNFSALLNSTAELIWVVDTDKRLLLANQASKNHFKSLFAVDMLPGLSSAELMPAEQAEYFDLLYGKALAGKNLKLNHLAANEKTYAFIIQPMITDNRVNGVSLFARDISDQARLQQELSRFEQIITSTPDMVSLIDRDYRYHIVNDAYLHNFALSREQIIGKSIESLVGKEHFRNFSEPSLKKAFTGEIVTHSGWMEVPRLGRRFLNVTYHPLHGQKVLPDYIAIDARDLTTQKLAEEDRQRIFDVSIDMLCVAGVDGYFRELNPAWHNTLGWEIDELKKRPWIEMVVAEDHDRTREVLSRLLAGKSVVGFENRWRCKDGSHKWLSWNCFPELENQRIFAAARDISVQKQLEEELRQLATSDPLTGASNRRHFIELAAAELKRSRRYGSSVAVLMLDVDYFKQVNDQYGHDAGDEVLVGLVRCCRQQLRETDIFGRFGGEEFAALLVESDEASALATCERLAEQIAALQFATRKGDIQISVSIGMTMPTADDFSIDPLLKRADDALYRAKNQGRNQIVKF